MASCLGIYSNQDFVKYAKVSIDSNKEFKVEAYGTRFVSNNDRKILISNIIDETNSKDLPIIINPEFDKFIDVQVYEQAKSKAYIDDVIRMEFEAWCEKNKTEPSKFSYVYALSDYKTTENKYSGIINITEDTEIRNLNDAVGQNLTSIVPSELTLHKVVPQDYENYVLVNLDDKLSISTIINKKLAEIKTYDVGMEQIFSDLRLRLGSYQKAYEACKQVNVYTEGKSQNDPTIEVLTEQTLQEVLKYVLVMVNKNRKDITKVLITGSGTVFTNIDILFTEFLDMKSEILKPEFLVNSGSIKNLAEVLETIHAISLACNYLKPDHSQIDYVGKKMASKFSLETLLSVFKKKDPSELPRKVKFDKPKADNNKSNEGAQNKNVIYAFDFEKFSKYAINGVIVIAVILVTYIVFNIFYSNNINKMLTAIADQDTKVSSKISEVNNDISYINSNVSQYKTINTQVSDLVTQIETGSLGKITTYNVASFLQQVIKIIPKTIQLKSISSDDNKNVKISAQSSSYADLGYFVAQLKLEGVLNSVKINSIQNGETILVEIGGELP